MRKRRRKKIRRQSRKGKRRKLRVVPKGGRSSVRFDKGVFRGVSNFFPHWLKVWEGLADIPAKGALHNAKVFR